MNRRDLIKAMLAAPVALAIPAISGSAVEPVIIRVVPGILGEIMWFGALNEVSIMDGDTVTYGYNADFAVSICEGPVQGIQRIWADTRCIYDKRPRLADETDAEHGARVALTAEIQKHLTVYLGTETQTVSPLIESYENVGQLPNFRGLHYVTFEKFPVEQYGNRVPVFAFQTA